MLRAIKYELRPNATQRSLINRTCGCCRFVYNSALERALEKIAPSLHDRNLYERLYEIATGNDKDLTIGECIRRIAYAIREVVTSPQLFDYGKATYRRAEGIKENPGTDSLT